MDIKLSRSYENSYTNPTVQFRHHQAMESVNSGENSPPLWKNNSPSPPKSPSHPLLDHHHHHHRFSSSDSRAQAIARGQWELMEMVKNMPESSYELSLKDLVENYHEIKRDDGSLENNQDLHQRAAGVVKLKRPQEESKKINYDRNKGLFLNMVFPFSLKYKKKKRSNFCSGKVSPKIDGLKGNGERDWWKKRFTGSSDSDSSRTSNNSGTTTAVSSGGQSSSSGGGKRNGLLTGCWPFFCSGRGQSRSVE